jgi:hypothetical protein
VFVQAYKCSTVVLVYYWGTSIIQGKWYSSSKVLHDTGVVQVYAGAGIVQGYTDIGVVQGYKCSTGVQA